MMCFFYLYLIISKPSPEMVVTPVMLGHTKVEIIKKIGHGKTFIHLHENEVTALRAASLFVSIEDGTLITLKHSGERNIVFYLKKTRYEFDPNRIFTDKGIKKTLMEFGHYSVKAHHEVKNLATKIKAALPNEKIIAIHNNHDYSLKEYFPHQPLVQDAKTFYYQSATNYRNFYFVTSHKDYTRLKKMNFNVVLQANHATDDGSLSFYLRKKNYVNIEAAYTALREQLQMLYAA